VYDHELLAILWVLTEVSTEPERLARVDIWKAPDNGDELTPVWHFEPSDGVSRIVSVVRHPLDNTM